MVASSLPLLAATAALLLLLHLLCPVSAIGAGYAAGANKPRKKPLPPRKPDPQWKQFLQPHNDARKAVGLRLLAWDPNLARFARSYAGQRRGDCSLVHSAGPYGENIFWGSGRGWTPKQVAAAWVAEKCYYNYYSNSCSAGNDCGHYTQIVWRDTRRLGCAIVTCMAGLGQFAVCEYDPPGNYVGEKPY